MQSIGGRLSVYALGFRLADADVGSRSTSSICDQIRIEVTLMPEKQLVLAATSGKLSLADGAIACEWSCAQSVVFSYSPQQRQVGFLTVRITEVCSAKKLSNRSAVLGSGSIDLCALVFKKQQHVVRLPVHSRGAACEMLSVSSSPTSGVGELAGWVMLGLGVDADASELKASTLLAWAGMLAPPSPHKGTRSLCILLGEVQSLSLEDKTHTMDSARLHVTVLSAAPAVHLSLAAHANRATSDPSASPGQLTATVDLAIAALYVEVRLTLDQTVLGRSYLSIPRDWLESGRPCDLVVPLRGGGGAKVGVLPIALSLSSAQPSAASTTPSPATTSSSRSGPVGRWAVLLSQANVFDPSWRFALIPHFEFCLSVYIADRTEPIACFARCTVSGTQNLNVVAELSSSLVWAEDEVDSAWLSVVCRDLGRPGCPEVASGKTDARDLLLSPVARRTVLLAANTDLGSSERMFEKRAASSSCSVGLQLLPPSADAASTSDALATVHLHCYELLVGEADRRRPSGAEMLRLVVSSTLDRQQGRRGASEGCTLSADVSVAGSEGSLSIELETKKGATLSGVVSLEQLSGHTHTSDVFIQLTDARTDEQSVLRARAVVVPHVLGRLALAVGACMSASSALVGRTSMMLRLDGYGSDPPVFSPLTMLARSPVETVAMVVSGAVRVDCSETYARRTILLVDMAKASSSLDEDCVVGSATVDADALVLEALKSCFVQGDNLLLGTARRAHTLVFTDSSKATIATVQVDLLFAIDAVAPAASEALARAVTASSSTDEQSRAELGLKQVFIAADVDDSSFVTYDEIVNVFRSQLKAKRGVHRVSRKKTPSAAMLDPMELLLRLGGADVDESDMSDTALLKVATAALKRLDLDGDGRVSWEEWLQVLGAAVWDRNPSSLVNPLDPFVVRLAGASNRIKLRKADAMPLAELAYSSYHGVVTRGMVKSRTKPNSSFASTMLSIRTLSDTLHSLPALEDEEPQTSPHGIHTPSIYSSYSRLLSRVMGDEDFDEQLGRNKASKELRKKNKLKHAQQSLSSFASKLVVRLRSSITLRNLANLRHLLRGMVVRRRFRRLIHRRYRGCVKIQSRFRGMQARLLLKQKNRAATSMQKVVRGFHDRSIARDRRKLHVLFVWMRMRSASTLLRRCIIKWGQRRREKRRNAAAVMQKSIRSTLTRMKRAAEAKRAKEQLSANSIQKIFRGRKGRAVGGLLRAEAASNKRISEKKNASAKTIQGKFRQAKQRESEKKNQESERVQKSISATKIQSLYRNMKKRSLGRNATEARTIPEGMVDDKAELGSSVKDAELENSSSRKIQALYRRRKVAEKAKAESAKIKADADNRFNEKEGVSARKIQCFYRGKKLAVAETNRRTALDSRRSEAAGAIQGFFRKRCDSRRPPIERTVGMLVEVSAEAIDEVFRGRVIAFFADRGVVRVFFETDDDEPFIDDLPHASPKITWVGTPVRDVCTSKPLIGDSIGYTVEVTVVREGRACLDEFFIGTVVAFDAINDTITVKYQALDDMPPETETLPFASALVTAWTAAAKIHPSVAECICFDVEVRAASDGVLHEDEFYSGTVIATSPATGTVTVEFEVEQEDAPEREDLPVDSPLIANWIRITESALVEVKRPQFARAVGALLYVGAERDSDMLGKVVSIDAKARAVSVVFLSPTDGIYSQEAIPYLSEDLVWVQRKTSY